MQFEFDKDLRTITIISFDTPREIVNLLMKLKPLSIEQLSRQSGLNKLTVMNILRGKSNITRYTSEKLAKVFNINKFALYKKQLYMQLEKLKLEIDLLEDT